MTSAAATTTATAAVVAAMETTMKHHTTSPSRLFQYYLNNTFKFPKDIKNDIIYCQRALKWHIKVHQMLAQQQNADRLQMKRYMQELETEIYEINAEQNILFLRLRRVIDEFYKVLKQNGIPKDVNMTNLLISKEVVPFVNDPSYEVHPKTVILRSTEESLIEKYCGISKDKPIYEIYDSDDEVMLVSEYSPKDPQTMPQIDLTQKELAPENCGLAKTGNGQNLAQMSLLKPIAQRMVSGVCHGGGGGVGGVGSSGGTRDADMKMVEEKNGIGIGDDPTRSTGIKEELPVSQNVKISRLNLRHALSKAVKAAANRNAQPTPAVEVPTTRAVQRVPSPALPSSVPVPSNKAVTKQHHQPHVGAHAKKYEIKTRATRSRTVTPPVSGTTASTATKDHTEVNTSSEDSNTEHDSTPPQSTCGPREPEEIRTQPEHYGQEMFLRIFNLFTPEVLVVMQQRRSKRKRRTVHSNERADFHYGRIEYGSLPPPEKKRKAFLLSPQVKRGLQAKRPKRASAEKNEEAAPSRSSSSSPDEKRCCNECLKGGGPFEQCLVCKAFYHQSCHREEDEEKTILIKKSCPTTKIKLCPPCTRMHFKVLKKAEINQNLQSKVLELQKQMDKEQNRRANLQLESKMYKIQMRVLFNIVNTIKSDQENDSSE